MKTVFAAAVFALAALTACALAVAAPINAKNAGLITIYCGSGTYTAVVNGNGNFTAAHDINSNAVLIPTAFGEFTATLDGVLVDVEAPTAKGSAVPANGKIQNCNYTVEFDTPDGHIFGSGAVTGFIPHL
jgi:hypothetical protein